MKNLSILALSVIALASLGNTARAGWDIDINIDLGPPSHRGYNPLPEFRDYIGPQVLGETRLSFRNDRDVVMVRSCERGIAVDAVKLKVQKNDARIDYVLLTLGNGQRLELNVRERFARGSESRWISLNGIRCVRSFLIFGETDNFGGRETKVKLIGNAFRVN